MITLEKMFNFPTYVLEKEVEVVFAYARKSRPKAETKDEENRVEKDLEMQVARLEEFCDQKGWKSKLFCEVQSGENITDRPVMQEMLQEIQKGYCDAVVVVDYDRLSRGSGGDQERILNVLRNAASLIVEVSGAIFNPLNKEDLTLLKMKGFFSNFEHVKIISRFTEYKRIGAKEGKWVSGKPPFGYDIDKKTKHLIINEVEGVIYQDCILKPFLGGTLVDNIAQELNEAKILSPQGKEWSYSTVVKLLKSELYCGTIIYNKTTGSKKSKDSINKVPFMKHPPEKWTYAYNAHPPLKTLEEHEEVLGLFKVRSRVQAKIQLHSLHELVKCYNCGKNMHIVKEYKGKKEFSFRACKCGENRGGPVELVNTAIRECISDLEKRLLNVKKTSQAELEHAMYAKEMRKVRKAIILNEEAIEVIEETYEANEYTLAEMVSKRQKRLDVIANLEHDLEEIRVQQNKILLINKDEKLEKLNNFKEVMLNHKDNAEKLRGIYVNLFESFIWERTEENEVSVYAKFR